MNFGLAKNNGRVNSYNVDDVRRLGYNLEPLKCKRCKKVGEVVFNQYSGIGYCQWCGASQ